MNSPYLSFPELPDGYVWYYDTYNQYRQDIDLLLDNSGPIEMRLRGWVHARDDKPLEVRERNGLKHTFAMPVDSIQDGIDLLAARCWLGLTGVPDA